MKSFFKNSLEKYNRINESGEFKRIEIPLSKGKMALLLIGSLAFVGIGLYLITNPSTLGNSSSVFSINMLVGIIAISVFGFFGFFIARKLFDSKPGLILDNLGFTDNSTATHLGQILWSDIENIAIIKMGRQKLILIVLKNPDEFISKQSNSYKRKMLKMSINLYGAPISISSNALKIKFDDLLNIFVEYLNASRR